MIWLANGDKVLYQWSRGNVLLANTQFDVFRMSREDDQKTVEVTPAKSGMLLRAAIPDQLMTESGYLRVACVVRKNDGETVAESARFTIRAAQRPKDYVYGAGETADWKVLRAQMNAILRDVREGKFNGLPGKDGATPYIGENKHWYISGIDTGIRAEGLDYILTGDDKDEIAGIVSEAFGSLIGELYTDGVLAADDPDALMVTAGGYDEETRTNTIRMAAGTLIINGKMFRLPAVSEEYYRRTSASKTVVVGYRYTVSTGAIKAMIWDGYTKFYEQDDGLPFVFITVSDTIPSRAGDNRDILCAMIEIPSGSMEITDDMITDLRGVERFCRFVESKLLDGIVKSVNGIRPDENGNVKVEVSGGGGNISVNFDEETGEMMITSASGNVKYDDSTGELTIGA